MSPDTTKCPLRTNHPCLRITDLKEVVSKADLNDEWWLSEKELEERSRQRIQHKDPEEREGLALPGS